MGFPRVIDRFRAVSTSTDEDRRAAAMSIRRGAGRAADLLTYIVLLGFGALAFGLPQHSADFFSGDTTYFELAHSIVDQGFYGFNSLPQTTLPPGFPAIMAFMCVTVGCTYMVFIRSMAVFAALGLIASYELLRREQGRAIAAVLCILLASSPLFFVSATRDVLSDLPYFFTSMTTLVLVMQLDRTTRVRVRAALWLLCCFGLVASVLIRSAGIALLSGLAWWLAASWFRDREGAVSRFKTFLPLLLVGVLVEALWMGWAAKHEILEWPSVGGYPHSYLAQVAIKSGNRPELGAARLGDIPARVAQKTNERSAVLMGLLAGKGTSADWFSPLVLGPIVLILMGVGHSLWRGGGRVWEWYFLSHEALYLLWPWKTELRFFLPVAPLAALYLWRGGVVFMGVASRNPRAVGAWSLVPLAVLALYSSVADSAARYMRPIVSAISWTLLAMISAWMAWSGFPRLPTWLGQWLSRSGSKSPRFWGRLTPPMALGVAAFAAVVGAGVARELKAGLENLAFDVSSHGSYADVQAGQWLRARTAPTAVVMARQNDVVYHHSRRRVVWFPPLADPQELMEGIRRHRVEFIVVNHREPSYWLPPEQDCFAALSTAYPTAFRLVHEAPRLEVFQIVPEFR